MKKLNNLQKIGLASAGVLAGVIAVTGVAAAADNNGTTSSGGTTTQSAPATGTTPLGAPPAGAPTGTPPKGVPGGKDPVRSDEKSVTAEQSATLSKIAQEKVSGGTVVRVESDAGDAAYEVHMTKADGTAVTVKFNEDLSFKAIEDGMGLGDPAPAGAPAGGPQGAAPQGAAPQGAAPSSSAGA